MKTLTLYGRDTGEERNDYEPDDPCRFFYKQGYDAGIAEYCKQKAAV